MLSHRTWVMAECECVVHLRSESWYLMTSIRNAKSSIPKPVNGCGSPRQHQFNPILAESLLNRSPRHRSRLPPLVWANRLSHHHSKNAGGFVSEYVPIGAA